MVIRMVQTVSCFVIAGLLQGCIFAPEIEMNQQKFSSTELNDVYTKPEKSRNFAINVRNDLRELQNEAAVSDRLADYALFGLATAGAVRAAGSRSKAPLKTFAIAAGGVLGLRGILDPQDLKKITRSGIQSIDCSMAVDSKLEQLHGTITGSVYSLTFDTGASARLAATKAAAIQTLSTPIKGAALSAQAISDKVTATVQLEVVARTNAALATAQSATDTLKADADDASSDASRATNLTRVIVTIIQAVQDELEATAPNPNKITSQAQQSISDSLFKLSSAKNQARAANSALGTAGTSDPNTAGAATAAQQPSAALITAVSPVIDYSSCFTAPGTQPPQPSGT